MRIDNLDIEYYQQSLKKIIFENCDYNIQYAIVFSYLLENTSYLSLIPKLKVQ